MKNRKLAVTGIAAAAVLLVSLLIWRSRVLPAPPDVSKARTDDLSAIERWPPGPVRLGVTIWRLQPANESVPPGAKIIVHPRGQSPIEFQPIRASLDHPFRTGDRVRVSFEAAQPGYLYVINRELRLAGSLGPPRMIFPTKRIRAGKNQVQASRPIEIPGQSDDPPFWQLERQSQHYSGERLIVLFAPEPVPGLEAGEDYRDLDESWLHSKLKQWHTAVATSRSSVESAVTPEELEAARPGAKILTHRDPFPQVVFSGKSEAGTPLAASVDLPFRP
jgi:hypothetical protein